jgi:hypothetical protein
MDSEPGRETVTGRHVHSDCAVLAEANLVTRNLNGWAWPSLPLRVLAAYYTLLCSYLISPTSDPLFIVRWKGAGQVRCS